MKFKALLILLALLLFASSVQAFYASRERPISIYFAEKNQQLIYKFNFSLSGYILDLTDVSKSLLNFEVQESVSTRSNLQFRNSGILDCQRLPEVKPEFAFGFLCSRKTQSSPVTVLTIAIPKGGLESDFLKFGVSVNDYSTKQWVPADGFAYSQSELLSHSGLVQVLENNGKAVLVSETQESDVLASQIQEASKKIMSSFAANASRAAPSAATTQECVIPAESLPQLADKAGQLPENSPMRISSEWCAQPKLLMTKDDCLVTLDTAKTLIARADASSTSSQALAVKPCPLQEPVECQVIDERTQELAGRILEADLNDRLQLSRDLCKPSLQLQALKDDCAVTSSTATLLLPKINSSPSISIQVVPCEEPKIEPAKKPAENPPVTVPSAECTPILEELRFSNIRNNENLVNPETGELKEGVKLEAELRWANWDQANVKLKKPKPGCEIYRWRLELWKTMPESRTNCFNPANNGDCLVVGDNYIDGSKLLDDSMDSYYLKRLLNFSWGQTARWYGNQQTGIVSGDLQVLMPAGHSAEPKEKPELYLMIETWPYLEHPETPAAAGKKWLASKAYLINKKEPGPDLVELCKPLITLIQLGDNKPVEAAEYTEGIYAPRWGITPIEQKTVEFGKGKQVIIKFRTRGKPEECLVFKFGILLMPVENPGEKDIYFYSGFKETPEGEVAWNKEKEVISNTDSSETEIILDSGTIGFDADAKAKDKVLGDVIGEFKDGKKEVYIAVLAFVFTKAGEKWVNSAELPITLTKTETIQPSSCQTILSCLAELGKNFTEQIFEGKAGGITASPSSSGSSGTGSSISGIPLEEIKDLGAERGKITPANAKKISDFCGASFNVPSAILLAQAHAESDFDTASIGEAGENSHGLSQISTTDYTACVNSDSLIKSLDDQENKVLNPAANVCCYAKNLAADSHTNWLDKLDYYNRGNACVLMDGQRKSYIAFIAQRSTEKDLPSDWALKQDFLSALGINESQIPTCS